MSGENTVAGYEEDQGHTEDSEVAQSEVGRMHTLPGFGASTAAYVQNLRNKGEWDDFLQECNKSVDALWDELP